MKWIRVYDGQYESADGNFEILKTQEGWLRTDRRDGNTTITRTLGDAKESAEFRESFARHVELMLVDAKKKKEAGR